MLVFTENWDLKNIVFTDVCFHFNSRFTKIQFTPFFSLISTADTNQSLDVKDTPMHPTRVAKHCRQVSSCRFSSIISDLLNWWHHGHYFHPMVRAMAKDTLALYEGNIKNKKRQIWIFLETTHLIFFCKDFLSSFETRNTDDQNP